jgi:hypothetical protein
MSEMLNAAGPYGGLHAATTVAAIVQPTDRRWVVRATLSFGRVAGIKVGINWRALAIVALTIAGLATDQLPGRVPRPQCGRLPGRGAGRRRAVPRVAPGARAYALDRRPPQRCRRHPIIKRIKIAWNRSIADAFRPARRATYYSSFRSCDSRPSKSFFAWWAKERASSSDKPILTAIAKATSRNASTAGRDAGSAGRRAQVHGDLRRPEVVALPQVDDLPDELGVGGARAGPGRRDRGRRTAMPRGRRA